MERYSRSGHVPRRLVGRQRQPEAPADPGRPEAPETGFASVDAARLSAGASAAAADRVGNLGQPLRGDETASLAGAAPEQTVASDLDVPPSLRRYGDGLVADSQNFQGRPNTSLTEGGDSTGAGGGSGL